MPSEYTWHMSRVHKRVLKLVNFEVQKVQKSKWIWFGDTYPLNQWGVLSWKIFASPFGQFEKHHFCSTDMWQATLMAKGMNRLQIQDRRSSEMNLNPPGICSPITMAINFGQQPVQMEHFLRKEQQQSQLFQLTNLQLHWRKARQAVNKIEL